MTSTQDRQLQADKVDSSAAAEQGTSRGGALKHSALKLQSAEAQLPPLAALRLSTLVGGHTTASPQVAPWTRKCAMVPQPQPIHSASVWKRLRATYQRLNSSHTFASPVSGFRVPYEVRRTAQRGRGIFVTAPVKKAELVWENVNTVEFDSEVMYRKFLTQVHVPLACDVAIWAYYSTRRGRVQLDLDEGSYMNGGCEAEGKRCLPELGNVACHMPHARRCTGQYYAQRDIPAGTVRACSASG